MASSTRKRIAIQIMATTAALALGILGFVLIVPTKTLAGDRLLSYVIKSPNLPGVSNSPSWTGFIPPTGSPIKILITDQQRAQYQTGGSSYYWYGVPSTANEANVLLEMLPTAADAATYQTQEATALIGTHTIESSGYRLQSRGTLNGFAGSVSAAYLIPHKKTTLPANSPAPPTPSKPISTKPVPAIVSLYRIGRFVVVENFQGAPATIGHVQSVANLERASIANIPQRFTLEQTNWPIGSAIFVVLLALIVLAAIWTIPPWYANEQVRRRERQLARERYQYRVRGSKTLRRGRVQF